MLLPEAIVGVAAGGQHTLLLAESGSVWATGSNSRGQLGLGKSAPAASLRPHRIPALAGGPRLAALSHSLWNKARQVVAWRLPKPGWLFQACCHAVVACVAVLCMPARPALSMLPTQPPAMEPCPELAQGYAR